MKLIILAALVAVACSPVTSSETISCTTSTAVNPAVVAKLPASAPTESKATVQPASPTEKTLSGVVKGTVKAMRGSSFGYVPPTEGQEFELDLHPPGQTHPQLSFKGKYAYIPFPKPFSVVDVEWSTSNEKPYWSSLRAVYKHENSNHKVTLDVSRHPGLGHPDYVIVWVLIENNDRIWGIAELHGLVKSPHD